MVRRKADTYNQQIGERLLKLRKSKHITQQMIARQLDISFQQVQKYEKGHNQISLLRLCDLAKALNVSEVFLFQYLLDKTIPETYVLSSQLKDLDANTCHLILKIIALLKAWQQKVYP